MSMNIKNKEAHRLAQQLSKLTGESVTGAVTTALRERVERLRAEQEQSLAERVLAIGENCAKHLREPFRSADHGDLLYDRSRLPK
jgi:antitoxin VapB